MLAPRASAASETSRGTSGLLWCHVPQVAVGARAGPHTRHTSHLSVFEHKQRPQRLFAVLCAERGRERRFDSRYKVLKVL